MTCVMVFCLGLVSCLLNRRVGGMPESHRLEVSGSQHRSAQCRPLRGNGRAPCGGEVGGEDVQRCVQPDGGCEIDDQKPMLVSKDGGQNVLELCMHTYGIRYIYTYIIYYIYLCSE